MYLCSVRVLHLSEYGQPYVRVHVVPVKTTLQAAVIQCGARPPRGATASLDVEIGSMPFIRYTHDVLPVAIDPPNVVVHLEGLQGGVFVDVPYKCTYDKLVTEIIPQKLAHIGVHPYDVHGSPEDEHGNAICARDLWREGPLPTLIWTKLRVRVHHSWPAGVLRSVLALQRKYQEKRNWILIDCTRA